MRSVKSVVRAFVDSTSSSGEENCFKSTVAQTKMGHVSKTTPLLGVILSSLWEDLIWSPFIKQEGLLRQRDCVTLLIMPYDSSGTLVYTDRLKSRTYRMALFE